MAGLTASRVIRCTESNAGEFRSLLRRWPELKALVQELQAADLFPGLRAMQITLTGSPDHIVQGLAAIQSEIGLQAAGDDHAH